MKNSSEVIQMSASFLKEFLESSDWIQTKDLLKKNANANILWIVNDSGKLVQRFEEDYHELCQLIRESQVGKRRCQNSHFARLQEVKRTKLPVISSCYCGLLAFAFPVITDGNILCIVGGCHSQSEFPFTMEKCAEISVACGLDIKDVIERSKKIRHAPKVEQRRLLSILNILAGMIAPAIKWMIKSKTLLALEGRYKAISDICKIIYSKIELKDKLKFVTNKVRDELLVDACSIYNLDRNSQELILKITSGLPETALGQRIKMGEGIIGHSAQEKTIIAVEDATKDPRSVRIGTTTTVRKRVYRSILAVPIISINNLIGVIDIRTFKPRIWMQDEIDFLFIIAEHIAIIKTEN